MSQNNLAPEDKSWGEQHSSPPSSPASSDDEQPAPVSSTIELSPTRATCSNFTAASGAEADQSAGDVCNHLSGNAPSELCRVAGPPSPAHTSLCLLLPPGAFSGVSNIFSFWGDRTGRQYQELPQCTVPAHSTLSAPVPSLSRRQKCELGNRLDHLQKQLNR